MFGNVKKVQLDKSLGVINGYVEMGSQKDLDEVILGLSGGSIDGCTISVKETEGPKLVSEKVYQQSKSNYKRYSRSPIRGTRRRSPPVKSTKRYYSRSPSPAGGTRRRYSPLRYSRSPMARRYSRSPRRRSVSPRRFSRSPKRETAARRVNVGNTRYRR